MLRWRDGTRETKCVELRGLGVALGGKIKRAADPPCRMRHRLACNAYGGKTRWAGSTGPWV